MAWGRADDPSARATHGVDAPFIFDRLETMGFSADAPDANITAIIRTVAGAIA